ncbi:hypothetical protein QWY85_05490 [Neolewinella lacunae]|uniref:Uncharacterized protein n=1 Tax=Neolewinella lacunae TaxID=1517758 RepID=A0A923T937_9BACT|nr:hypothetical protein [Neolewinella lacunae]MBC6995154.1 hypothetical protein [Neolewinella lacunae]MDN3634104.1 hypothetical protein [Neolewinella lacunae]
MEDRFNNWHPLPRYGLAAAIHDWRSRIDNMQAMPELHDTALAELAGEALTKVQFGFLLEARTEGVAADTVTYSLFNQIDRLAPGSKSGQNAANGFFLAPHVLTSNNSGMMVQEFKALQKALKGGLDKSYQLKRSFSPQTSKINAGTKSMSDPKDELLAAAYTAVGAATANKAAALDYDTFTNIGLIPDIPFSSPITGGYPLLDYLKSLSRIQKDLADAYVGRYDPEKKKYIGRPPIYRGNFRNALNNVNFGILQLLAAFSGLIVQGEEVDKEEIVSLVDILAGRPMMIIGYDYNGQQQFGTHLTEITANGELYRALNEVWKIELVGVDSAKKYKSPHWEHLKRNLDRWLRRFDPASLRGFLSVRANYPVTFLPLIHKYFLMQEISKEVVDSAMAMGKSLNSAAYKAAKDKYSSDKGVTERNISEYKSRVLSSLEGNIRSAKGGSQLLSQVSTLIGRMTSYDLSPKSAPFMKAVLTGEVDYKVAQDLLIAFMRLNQGKKKEFAETTTDTDTLESVGFSID